MEHLSPPFWEKHRRRSLPANFQYWIILIPVWIISLIDRWMQLFRAWLLLEIIFLFILFKRYISFFVNFDFLIISCYDPLEGIVDLKRFFQFQSLLLFNFLQDYTDVDYNSKKILTIRLYDVLNHGFNFFKNIINDIIIISLLIIHKFNHSNNRSLDDIFFISSYIVIK